MTKDDALNLLKENNWDLSKLPNEFRSDKEIVLEAVKNDGLSLLKADKTLQKDKELVLIAVTNSTVYCNLSYKLKKDKEVIFATMAHDPIHVIVFGPSYCRRNSEFMLKALDQISGSDLLQHYVTKSLRRNKKFVLACVSNDGEALNYAAKSLKKDKEVVLAAVSDNCNAIVYADKSLRNDADILNVLEKNQYN